MNNGLYCKWICTRIGSCARKTDPDNPVNVQWSERFTGTHTERWENAAHSFIFFIMFLYILYYVFFTLKLDQGSKYLYRSRCFKEDTSDLLTCLSY